MQTHVDLFLNEIGTQYLGCLVLFGATAREHMQICHDKFVCAIVPKGVFAGEYFGGHKLHSCGRWFGGILVEFGKWIPLAQLCLKTTRNQQ